LLGGGLWFIVFLFFFVSGWDFYLSARVAVPLPPTAVALRWLDNLCY